MPLALLEVRARSVKDQLIEDLAEEYNIFHQLRVCDAANPRASEAVGFVNADAGPYSADFARLSKSLHTRHSRPWLRHIFQ
ncbi:MAG: hypothetical protein ACR2PI_00180 [Hyphomicrobiaceae bacterium]